MAVAPFDAIVSATRAAALNMKGIAGMPAEQVARAYVRSIEGSDTGQVIDARRFAAQEG
ncbi:hypothetical protein [Cystobacter ferrugineus]|uniref:hypothetical protein n=1 Tax=Cystobacter ferrugineus TaxID=83449 RepID=UPI000ACFA7FF|nr:hypothetical protein [Cystobacter ferrugineus]